TSTNIADAQTDPGLSEPRRALARVYGYQSLVVVPLLRHDEVLGTIAVTRREPGGFTDDETALLKTFADQAVIAIENVRLFNETKEALEQQTATSEILQVISSSPTDEQPVFDTIAEHAVRLCDAAFGAVFRFDGEWINLAALSGLRPDEREAVLRYFPIRPTPGGPGLSRVMQTGAAVHIPDVQVDPGWRAGSAGPHFSTVEGFRTFLAVPLMREGQCLGAVNVWRREVSPFSEQHIALLKTFADQAVIAIENVRLFNETKEALDRQTATSEILGVISSSPTDVQPTFEAIARAASILCEADFGSLFPFDGGLIHLGAHSGRTPEETDAALRAFPQRPSRSSVTSRAILAGDVVQIADVGADPEIHDALRIFRTALAVPMMRDGRSAGAITVARRVV